MMSRTGAKNLAWNTLRNWELLKHVTAWVNAVSWSWLRYRLGISMAITVPLVFELSLRYVFRRPVHEQTPYFSLRGAATLHVVLHQGMGIHPPSCHLSGAFRHDSTMFDPSYHYGGDGMDLDALGGIGEEYFGWSIPLLAFLGLKNSPVKKERIGFPKQNWQRSGAPHNTHLQHPATTNITG